jgi:2-polyprenyl-6-methoxyphenol hydroxylase-like FAD-dependent oxidoreductase
MTLTVFEKSRDADTDVIVAGGGPVGLMLACELRLGGASVVVLDRRTEIDPTIKAGSLNVPAVEALYRRGLLPALAQEQRRTQEQMMAFLRQRFPDLPVSSQAESSKAEPARPKVAGHFAGHWLKADLIDVTDPEFADHGPAEAGALVGQQAVEALLGARAAEPGVRIRRGVEVTGIEVTGIEVTGIEVTGLEAGERGVAVNTADGGQLRAKWLVGCDGGRSLVRRQAGFDFPGTPPEITGHQAMVEMTGSEALQVGWNLTGTGVYAFGPAPGRILTVEFDGPPQDRDTPVTAAELQASLRNVSGAEVTITAVRSATRFTDNARQASTYRIGRVLLAGDAAHVHSPFSGQGLNLGLGDAMNLGWKLAAVIAGWAPETLLDTYTAERHPIGAWVLDWTRAQVAMMRPDPHSRALGTVVDDLMNSTAGATYFAKRISGVWQRYDLSGGDPVGGELVGGELVGRSAPDLELDDGTRLADHLHAGRGLLLVLTSDPALRNKAGGWDGRVQILDARSPDRRGLSAMLVRPDGYVAWTAGPALAEDSDAGNPDSGHGRDDKALSAALATWFGPPAPVAVHT